MGPLNLEPDEHLLPEFAALFQAVEELRQRLMASPSILWSEPVVSTDSVRDPRLDGETRIRLFQAIFFGRFTLYRNGQSVALGQQWSCLELCRYLIAQRDRLVPRDEILEVLWPDAVASRNGLHRLHVTVSSLRRLVDPANATQSLIQFEGECYGVSANAVDTDFSRFDVSFSEAKRRLARGDRAGAVDGFRAAIALYRGDFLADHPYAEWTHLLRDHFRERRLTALSVLCECAEHERDYHAVLDLAAEILAIDNLREMAHRHIMRARYWSGERGLAIRQYETCSRLLRAELGVEPSHQSRRLYTAICDDSDLPGELSSLL
jgi:DNA-binding SARP family transcriptional activator